MSPSELSGVDEAWIHQAIALVICPAECALSTNGTLNKLDEAIRVVAVVADSVKTPWYASQYNALGRLDAFCDVGFVDQRRWNPISDIPYHFVFNAGLDDERKRLQELQLSERPLAWALIAHMTPDRAQLGNDLLTRLGPQGFLFLPSLKPVRPGEGMLSPRALHRLLEKASCYVWRSHHTYPYYESFRFVDAILAGAVPCKIDDANEPTLASIPNIYSSVDGLLQALDRHGASSLFETSRAFYMDQGTLGDQLIEFFNNV